jgi:hypothetical protein
VRWLVAAAALLSACATAMPDRVVIETNAPPSPEMSGPSRTLEFHLVTAEIRSLVDAIRAAPAPAPTPALRHLRLEPDWVDKGSCQSVPRERLARLAARLRDPTVVREVIMTSAGIMVEDDRDYATVTLLYPDGARISAETRHKGILMLPWTITTKGRRVESWDPRISYAVAELLPKQEHLQNRLAGTRGSLLSFRLFEFACMMLDRLTPATP